MTDNGWGQPSTGSWGKPSGDGSPTGSSSGKDAPGTDKQTPPTRSGPGAGSPPPWGSGQGQSGHGLPPANQQGNGGSGDGSSSYGQPSYGQQTYGQPAYGQQAYWQPSGGKPEYGQPSYGQPSNAEPGNAGAPQGWQGRGGGPYVRPALRPGVIPLRPLNLGEIFDGAIQVERSNPRSTIGLAAIVSAVTGLLSLVVNLSTVWGAGGLESDPFAATSMAYSLGSMGSSLIVAVVAVVAQALVTGMLIVAVGQAVMGRRTSLSQLMDAVRGKLGRLIGAVLLVTLLQLAVFVPAVGVGLAVGMALSPDAGVGIGLLLGLAGMCAWVFLMVRFMMVGPVIILEDLGVMDSLRRSWRLSGKGFWRLLGIGLLAWIVTGIVAAIIVVPFTMIGAAIGGFVAFQSGPTNASFTVMMVLIQVLAVLGQIVAGAITLPFSAGVYSLLYLDARMRNEGFDVTLNAQAHQEASRAAGPPAPGSPGTSPGTGWSPA